MFFLCEDFLVFFSHFSIDFRGLAGIKKLSALKTLSSLIKEIQVFLL